MGKSSAPPPSPDYAGAAQATAAGNLDMLKYQTEANRISQYNPWGSLTYNKTSTFDQAGYDKALADWQAANQPQGSWQELGTNESGESLGRQWVDAGTKSSIPMPSRDSFTRDAWTQTESLSPEIQKALDSQIAIQQGRSDAANSMLGTVKSAYSQPFTAPSWDSYFKNLNSVDNTSLGRAGDFTSNATLANSTYTGGPDQSSVGRAGAFTTSSQVASLAPFLRGVQGIEQDGVGNVGGFTTDARVNTNIDGALSSVQGLNQFLGRFGDSGNGVNLNTPAFTNARQGEYAKAAYDSQMGLLGQELAQQDERTNNRLALQGLSPGSEASNNALAVFNDARSRQLNSLASQSVLTGNEMSNRDYASQLAGFRAGNEAEGQRFGQNLTAFTTNRDTGIAENAARGQAFAQALQRFGAGNEAQLQKAGLDNTDFQNNLQAILANNQLQQSRNAARGQAFNQGLQAFGAYNAGQGQQFAQDQAAYAAGLQGLNTNAALRESDNAAQQQAFAQYLAQLGFNNQTAQQQFGMDQARYDNTLRALTTNAGLQQAYNQAQQQAYAQALQNYGTNWQQAQTLRNMPLNELNALLTGQQVQNPDFQGFAQQGYAPGADYLGASQLQGQWDTNVYNAQQAQDNAFFGGLAQLGGAAMGAAGQAGSFAALFSDERLKKNIEKVGETAGGTNVYTWDWNSKAKAIGVDDQPTVGVLAQENPKISKKDKKTGYFQVDYSRLK